MFQLQHLWVHPEWEDQLRSADLLDIESVAARDFEKTRKTLTRNQSIIEDVSRFLRHSPNLSRELQLRFLRTYFQTERFTPAQTKLIRKMRGAPELEITSG